jgi:hypothetical protein
MNINRMMLLVLTLSVSSSMALASNEDENAQGSHPRSMSTKHNNTDAKSDSSYVRGHKTKNGTYVKGHRRSKPDHNFSNNWTTKGNDNPYTGKDGSRATPPSKTSGSSIAP